MPWPLTAVMIALLAASIITGSLASYAYQNHRQSGALEFATLMVALTIYSFGYGFELSSKTLSQVMFWNKVEYLGIAFIPLFWIMLASSFSGISKRITSFIFYILLPICIGVLIADFTNDFHHLYYTRVEFNPRAPFPVATYTMGPLGLGYLVYLYAALFGGNVLLVATLVRTAKLYRSQIYIVISGSMVTWLGNIIYSLGLTPYDLDLNPFAFTITGLIFTWGVVRHKLFELSPIARGIIFNTMREGVLVLDLQNRIVDYNPRSKGILTELTSDRIGLAITEILGSNPGLMNQVSRNLERSEFSIEGQKKRWIDSKLTVISSDAGAPIGKVIILNDITLQHEAQTHLIETEKITTLGHLVSNVVHEMNTPLAAIKATAENMEQSLELIWENMVFLLDGPDEKEKQLCQEVFGNLPVIAEDQASLPGEREQRILKMIQLMQERAIHSAEDIAASFEKLGIAKEFERFIPMIGDPRGKAQLQVLLAIVSERQKINCTLLEEEKAAKIVVALKSYSHP